MKPIELRTISDEEHTELGELYDKTKKVRIRTRAQMILLAAEQKLTAPQIAEIVQKNDQTVRRWIRRFNAEGVNGLLDVPRPGAPHKVTSEYREKLLSAVRRRPRSLDLPYSLWALQRLVDYLAEQTGLRVSTETVRLHLKALISSLADHNIKSAALTPNMRSKKGD